MKVCVFAGAGFSKAVFNQKIQADFVKDFIESKESADFIEYFSDEYVKLLYVVEDIEMVMSHLYNMGYGKFETNKIISKKYQRAIIFFRMAIAIYYRNNFYSKADLEYEKHKLVVNNYFSRMINSGDVSIITTNYDLGFNLIFDHIAPGRYFYSGVEDRQEGAIPIMKLHGSIDWMQNRGSLEKSGFFNSRKCELDILYELNIVSLEEDYEFSLVYNDTKYSPILIPFFYQKDQFQKLNAKHWGEFFDRVWSNAEDALVKADKIIFMGYGLPSADHHMFTFIYNALQKSKASITIIDKLCCGEKTMLMKLVEGLDSVDESRVEIYKGGLIEYIQGCGGSKI